MAGGWVAATGILAGLYARAVDGEGRRVVTSLLGAGMLTHSGVFVRDGALVRGPSLDAKQTGYGPGPAEGPKLMLPRVGEHTVEVLTELGLPSEETEAILAAKAARRLDEEQA
jgi:crotonobetainyl-CoA:carnitine CoA-transferase CaiB-like acyl-CoA transferase